jgi:uncharacterized low-complexity protein
MQIRKTLIGVLALAIAIALSPVQGVQAASSFGPGSQAGTENLTYTVKAKAKAKGKAKMAKPKAKAKGKKAKSKPGPGRCGTGKYWDRKKRSCASK